ncbi:uncharacterized protein DFL_003097 [Arthrobotrys flagrans]|uniref:Senescence domain-containing protein n=1 Tax=Arthrobotrys flagrans TaxID=97331 RepID=A0A437ACE6_ARTFL|nr:hypothetical protein DFL_003097 [Arthrobotrys flagrans]
MGKKNNRSKGSNKQQKGGSASQAPVEQPQGPPRVFQEYFVPSHGLGQEPRRTTPEIHQEKMVTVGLSPPRVNRSREPRTERSPEERTSHKAAIRHNLTLTDRVYSNVQDAAYQAGFEIQNACKHPHQIPGRLGNVVMGVASGAANMGADLGQAVVSEAGGAGMMLVDSCGRLVQEAGSSAHRVAKRAARRASNHLFGIQEQNGGMRGGYGTRDGSIKRGEAEEDGDGCAWPEEEEELM